MSAKSTSEEEVVEVYLSKLSGHVWGLSLGLLLALGLFVATNILVLKGGENVGQHLGILSQYFWGYDVTFAGSLVGAFWAFVFGYVAARVVCGIYNLAARE